MTRAAGTGKMELSSHEARHRQNWVAGIATIGGFLFGYDTGVISGALLYLAPDLHLSTIQQSFVVSCLLLGAAVGGTFGGRAADAIGRSRLIFVVAIVFAVTTLGSALSPGFAVIIGFRVVLGLAVGAVSAVVPMYLGEIAPTGRRGRLVNQNELMVVFGQLAASVVNAVIANTVTDDLSVWRWMLGAALLPAVLLFVGCFFLPDSPRWLIGVGRDDEASQVLHRLRTPGDADDEFDYIKENTEKLSRQTQNLTPRRLLSVRWVRVLVLIGIGVSLAQQLAGVNAVVYYAPTLLQAAGLGTSTSVLAGVAIGVVGLIGVSVGMWMVQHYDRRPMLMLGLAGAAVSHALIALMFALLHGSAMIGSALAFMLVFIFFQQAFISVVTWLVLSEMFPMRVRGFAMGIAVFFQWLMNFAVSEVFPNIASSAGPSIGFGIFAVLSVLGLLFTKFVMPETRGETLEQLEHNFRERYST